MATASYRIDGREVVAEAEGLKVSVLTLGNGQKVPWHHHSNVTDTFLCMDGPMQVETRNPETRTVLRPGERTAVPAGRPHEVSGVDGGPCRFLIVQGVGKYDFVPD